MKETITCFYSCPDCALVKVPCEIPARLDEDIKTWMDATILVFAADHARRSPHCQPKMLHDIMIPVTGADRIGGAPVN